MKTKPPRPPAAPKLGVIEKADLPASRPSFLYPCLVIAAVILAVIMARLRLLGVPLERDEGEYGYLGQLILHGIPPYGVAANMKLPGTYLVYAAFMAIFGQTATAIHLGLLLVDLVSAGLIYAIGRRLFSRDMDAGRFSPAAFAAAGTFLVLSIGQGVMGLWAHATHFVVVFALAATLMVLKWSVSRKLGTLIASGLLYGLAFVMKQPGAIFALFGVFWIVWTHSRPNSPQVSINKERGPLLGRLLLFAVAAAAPFGGVCFWLWRAGVFDKFWFWTVTYGGQYGSMMSLQDGLQQLWRHGTGVVSDAWPVWILAMLGAGTQISGFRKRPWGSFLMIFFVLSFLAICPGLYFREHYFVMLLPAIALLTSAFIAFFPTATGPFGRTARMWIVTVALVFPILGQGHLLFELSPTEVSKAIYPTSPFVEAVEAAKYIRQHSSKDTKIAILGSEPEIFFYADRTSATPFVYVYSLMEPHRYAARMQDEFIEDIDRTRPEYIVLIRNQSSWLTRRDSTRRILEWWPSYVDAHYDQVGLADMLPGGITNYYWDAEAGHTQATGRYFVAILKKNGN